MAGPVRHPPRKQTVGMSKYRPYSWTIRSAAAFDTPNNECIQPSIDIDVDAVVVLGGLGQLESLLELDQRQEFGRSP